MRILLTGMTNMQQNRMKKRTYNTSINALYHALKGAGHIVDWRRLEFDEKKLDQRYELLILGLGTISEFSCTALYETLLATKYESILYYVNDWKANATIRLLRDGDLFREFVMKNNMSRIGKAGVIANMKIIERCRQTMFRFGGNVLAPFFAWGDRGIIFDGTPFTGCHEFNPTSFYLKQWRHKPELQLPTRKKKQWVYGALADYSKWHDKLQLTWPVLAFNKKTFIPENELIKRYAASYGMLMPKYKASGSGWWRARYCHAILCENVIYSDPIEWGEPAGNLYTPAETIERMSPRKLKALAEEQKDYILKLTPKWDYVVDGINEIVMEYAK